MRYNVHQSRNKIGRFLGVLVAAALVANAGAAECRPGAEIARHDRAASCTPMRTGFTITWTTRALEDHGRRCSTTGS